MIEEKLDSVETLDPIAGDKSSDDYQKTELDNVTTKQEKTVTPTFRRWASLFTLLRRDR
ncbi:8755_t:CDS:2 [Scutellospora calospora]|uniref:8755_t:CDS:1 n=1 Tax=Scutellospora calospora TaxID=85575 RepID=A0ACA9L918_9GLOM|nr:8755_t:CDS:2 [Scutellospora calospora]